MKFASQGMKPLNKAEYENKALIKFASQHASQNPDIDYYVFGHRHLLIKENVSDNAEGVILGDWISLYSYACFDGNELKINTYKDF